MFSRAELTLKISDKKMKKKNSDRHWSIIDFHFHNSKFHRQIGLIFGDETTYQNHEQK